MADTLSSSFAKDTRLRYLELDDGHLPLFKGHAFVWEGLSSFRFRDKRVLPDTLRSSEAGVFSEGESRALSLVHKLLYYLCCLVSTARGLKLPISCLPVSHRGTVVSWQALHFEKKSCLLMLILTVPFPLPENAQRLMCVISSTDQSTSIACFDKEEPGGLRYD
jgi:hypothetical protein